MNFIDITDIPSVNKILDDASTNYFFRGKRRNPLKKEVGTDKPATSEDEMLENFKNALEA